MNIEQIGKINEKAKMYIKDEELGILDIKETIENINRNYETDNVNKLEEIEIELNNSLKKINKNHNTDIYIIEKNINKYKEISKKTENIFKDII